MRGGVGRENKIIMLLGCESIKGSQADPFFLFYCISRACYVMQYLFQEEAFKKRKGEFKNLNIGLDPPPWGSSFQYADSGTRMSTSRSIQA